MSKPLKTQFLINEDKKIVYWPYKINYIKAVKQRKKIKLIKVKIVDGKRYFLLTTPSRSTKVKPGN